MNKADWLDAAGYSRPIVPIDPVSPIFGWTEFPRRVIVNAE
jgi:hypothetical protein